MKKCFGRRLLAALLVGALVVGGLSSPAQASTEGAVALGLASFAVFSQFFWPIFAPRVVYYPPAYYYPSYPTAAYPPPTSYTAPSPVPVPTMPAVIYYPHGRYELRGDGVTTAYSWVWIPNSPPPPPPPSLPGSP